MVYELLGSHDCGRLRKRKLYRISEILPLTR